MRELLSLINERAVSRGGIVEPNSRVFVPARGPVFASSQEREAAKADC